MRVRLSFLALLLAVLVPSAKSSAFRVASTATADAHHGHAKHDLPYMQQTTAQLRAQLPRRIGPPTSIAIDGSKNPELISDSIAYGHFIRATASSASARDLMRRDAFLKQAGLISADRAAYMLAVGNLKAELDAVKTERETRLSALSVSDLERLKRTEDLALSAAQSRIRSGLSADGAAKLEAHIQQHVKRRIRIVNFSMK